MEKWCNLLEEIYPQIIENLRMAETQYKNLKTKPCAHYCRQTIEGILDAIAKKENEKFDLKTNKLWYYILEFKNKKYLPADVFDYMNNISQTGGEGSHFTGKVNEKQARECYQQTGTILKWFVKTYTDINLEDQLNEISINTYNEFDFFDFYMKPNDWVGKKVVFNNIILYSELKTLCRDKILSFNIDGHTYKVDISHLTYNEIQDIYQKHKDKILCCSLYAKITELNHYKEPVLSFIKIEDKECSKPKQLDLMGYLSEMNDQMKQISKIQKQLDILINSNKCSNYPNNASAASNTNPNQKGTQQNSNDPILQEILHSMVKCPVGKFIVGGYQYETSNIPEQQIIINQEFYISKYPITQKQYFAITNKNPSFFKNEDSPVEGVSQNDAHEFCLKLNELTQTIRPRGFSFDLPLALQWEYACCTGKNLTSIDDSYSNLDEVGWYSQNSNNTTQPVGLKKQNDWGIYDMHGNVWEWCKDFLAPYVLHNSLLYSSDTPDEANRNTLYATIRGGSWNSSPKDCSLNKLTAERSTIKSNEIGFRVVLVQNTYYNLINTLNMHFCPSGSFKMGSPSNEPGRLDHERQHTVTITKDFYLSSETITQAIYEKIMGYNPSKFKSMDEPVENVSWIEAKMFCDKLNELTNIDRPSGYKFDLPTEAQWEYACRAGGEDKFRVQSIVDKTFMENLIRSKYIADDENKPQCSGIWSGSNPWGFHDMHGNVWEWCNDWYGEYPEKDCANPQGPDFGEFRILRGGSYLSPKEECRSASRKYDKPESKHCDNGFRIALVRISES